MSLGLKIEIGDVPASFRPFAEAVIAGTDPVEGLVRLLGTLGGKAPPGEARDFALLLRRALPPSARLARVSEIFIRGFYPHWYIRAVNDRHRNTAYRHAIENLVKPGTLVLEAGTGSGLFAMMAARAGAEHVYTCESDPHVARIARENIARNGLDHRISLIEGLYEDLRVGEHLPRRADLFLHEFVAQQFMVADMASILTGLRDTVLTAEAAILPSAFAAVGMLVGDQWPLDAVRVPGKVEGFDLRAINLFAAAGISLRGPIPVEQPLSGPTTLAELDLISAANIVPDQAVTMAVAASGTATGVLQWVRHGFPDGSAYENRPERDCNWWPNFWPFPRPIPVAAGQELWLRVRSTDTEIFIDPSG